MSAYQQGDRPETAGPYQPTFGFPVSDWFRYFAWRPVHTVDRGWRWLRPVWRRRIAKHDYLQGGADFWWQDAVSVEKGSSPESDGTSGTDAKR